MHDESLDQTNLLPSVLRIQSLLSLRLGIASQSDESKNHENQGDFVNSAYSAVFVDPSDLRNWEVMTVKAIYDFVSNCREKNVIYRCEWRKGKVMEIMNFVRERTPSSAYCSTLLITRSEIVTITSFSPSSKYFIDWKVLSIAKIYSSQRVQWMS